jgi:hypothetical protein
MQRPLVYTVDAPVTQLNPRGVVTEHWNTCRFTVALAGSFWVHSSRKQCPCVIRRSCAASSPKRRYVYESVGTTAVTLETISPKRRYQSMVHKASQTRTKWRLHHRENLVSRNKLETFNLCLDSLSFGLLNPEYGSSTFLRDYTVLQSRKPLSKLTSPWKPQMLLRSLYFSPRNYTEHEARHSVRSPA